MVLRQGTGDHYIMTKPGMSRPVVIPRKSDLAEDIVLTIARTIKLDKKDLRRYLGRKKKQNAPLTNSPCDIP
jgi:hypothetical protein